MPGRAHAAALADGSNEILFSAASIWELSIKHACGRFEMDRTPGMLGKAALRMDARATAGDAGPRRTSSPIHRRRAIHSTGCCLRNAMWKAWRC